LRTLVAHHTGWALVGVLGPRVLPSSRGSWQPPMDADRWDAVADSWRKELGDYDAVAVYERPQASRSGVSALLIADGHPKAFVKLRQEASGLDRSERVLSALAATPSTHFHSPSPLAGGAEGEWEWLALSPMPLFPHRPARRPPVARIVADIQDRLAPVLERTAVPAHWRPMHGDLTPWNMRRVGPRALWLLDWEEVGWGPPGADEVYYSVTASALLGPRRGPQPADAEAVRFWRRRVGSRPSGDFDRVLNVALDGILAAMAGPEELDADEEASGQPSGPECPANDTTAASNRSPDDSASKLAATWRRAASPMRARRPGSSSSDSTADTKPSSSSGGTR
jgi:hypothetical protein